MTVKKEEKRGTEKKDLEKRGTRMKGHMKKGPYTFWKRGKKGNKRVRDATKHGLRRLHRLHNCIYAINGQTKEWNYTNFKSNLAMMVIYTPVKFEFDWTKRFRVRVWKL